jgi:hypothetical protein
MKIFVFTEGTVLMHPSAQGLSRAKRVEQSKYQRETVLDYKNYVPNGNAVDRVKAWKRQGAEIYYMTSRTLPDEINDIQNVLQRYGFPDYENLLFRQASEEYKDVTEHLMPDILVEDDCESIGGEAEMVYPHLSQDAQDKIKSVVVKEFGGIDHLPGDLRLLLTTG